MLRNNFKVLVNSKVDIMHAGLGNEQTNIEQDDVGKNNGTPQN